MESDYTFSEVVEIGNAQEVILGGKDIFQSDDGSESQPAGEFDE